MTGAAEEPVRIEPYDPRWPARFEEERAALADAIGDWVVGGIHHVGSTAVPGLDAKPVIDILVGVSDLPSSRACIEPLRRIGYLYAPYRASEMHCSASPTLLGARTTSTWCRPAPVASGRSSPSATTCVPTRRPSPSMRR